MFRRLTATVVAALTVMTGVVAAGPTTSAYAASTWCGATRIAPATWTVTDSSYSHVATRFTVPKEVTGWTAALTSPTGRIPIGTSLVSSNSVPRWNMVAETLYKWGFRAGGTYKVTFIGSRAAKDGGQCTQVITDSLHLRSATAITATFSTDSTNVKVSGTLKRVDWKAGTMALFANRTVKVQWRKGPSYSTWTTKATVVTSAAGKFTAKVKRAAGQWRVVSVQTSTYAESAKTFTLATGS